MDFFEEQERARSRTGWLILLFGLAVCGTVMAVYAAMRLALQYAFGRPLLEAFGQFWNGDLFWRVAANTVALIAAVSFFKIRALSASADSVVLGLGGQLLDPNTNDPHQRRLLNVVEEMAIASGVPVPAVYLLPDEPGINALAVGLDASRSAIAVTDGCLKVLSRDELQGVIAHEFSHLLNGDSKINLRLLGLVHGILLIGLIGSRILRSFGRSSSSESRRKVNPGGLGVIVFVGVALYLIGSIGVFFTRLIKAAVCRERELLADASGVQFTRNAAGLAGALKKIGRLDRGSRLVAPGAEEASHFYFSEGIAHFTALMSTHPPLEQRIRLLDPSFQGELPRGQLQPVAVDEEIPVVAAAVQSERGFPVHPRAVIASVGALGDEHIAYAQSLVARIPERLRDFHPGALGGESDRAGTPARSQPGDEGRAADHAVAAGEVRPARAGRRPGPARGHGAAAPRRDPGRLRGGSRHGRDGDHRRGRAPPRRGRFTRLSHAAVAARTTRSRDG